jgi:hypothetical protein
MKGFAPMSKIIKKCSIKNLPLGLSSVVGGAGLFVAITWFINLRLGPFLIPDLIVQIIAVAWALLGIFICFNRETTCEACNGQIKEYRSFHDAVKITDIQRLVKAGEVDALLALPQIDPNHDNALCLQWRACGQCRSVASYTLGDQAAHYLPTQQATTMAQFLMQQESS